MLSILLDLKIKSDTSYSLLALQGYVNEFSVINTGLRANRKGTGLGIILHHFISLAGDGAASKRKQTLPLPMSQSLSVVNQNILQHKTSGHLRR